MWSSASQAVVYEKPGFQGSCREVDSNIFSFSEGEDAVSKKPTSVESLKIVGGMWVFLFFCFTFCYGTDSKYSLAEFQDRNLRLYNSGLNCGSKGCMVFLPAGWATASPGLKDSSTSWRKENTGTAATGEAQMGWSRCSQFCLWVRLKASKLGFSQNDQLRVNTISKMERGGGGKKKSSYINSQMKRRISM